MNVLFRSDNYAPVESHLFGVDGKEIRTYKTTAIRMIRHIHMRLEWK
jgi:hypothetical protein